MKRMAQACDTCMPRKRGMIQRPRCSGGTTTSAHCGKSVSRKRRISQRGYRRPNSAELVAEYKSARRCLNKAIKDSKKNCWKELINEVDKDLWGRPYKVVMAHLKYQPMPSPTCPQLLLKIVTALFPRQREFIYTWQQLNPEDIPLVTKQELMETCNRVGNNKAPGLQRPIWIPEGALDAINLVVNITKDAIAGIRWKGGTKEYCLVVALDIRNAFNYASWVCIMQALRGKNVPEYLCRIVASYFTGRVLKYDTKNGPKEYDITGGVPQGSVLGPLLWNIMYDGLLRLNIPRCVKLVAYADDVAVVIVAKHLDEICRLFDITFEQVNRWMDTVNLQLAKHKTEAVLITSRKVVEIITLRVGDLEITSQPHIRYLRVMLDARLNFKQQVEHVIARASAVVTSLARLMPNVGGPKETRRLLLSSVVTSALTYGISIWADALDTQESLRKAGPVYRRSELRVASAFRTISEEAMCVISGTLPLRILADERQILYQRRKSEKH
ncbi:Retrovirus-related Pol polyprotein from type-1 retrotransposable element R1 [Eumeta japonica]|uniref:Retrovirus-related Pol polyprotein from type-1 retrotransposable element R1 n=1 Tax=Eumeta variegata TaxID=151549 RepID=A0A4C1YLW3_EUMVA|nr:Retrovirus-related Pol polyprotein from type-1 retrotransposable element R1 [Eumeta japonica]